MASEEALQAVADVFSRIDSAAEMRQFFDEILTTSEACALALRWLLLQKLKAGVPQRKIAADLGISLCKITRGSKILKDNQSITRRLLAEDTKVESSQ